MLLPVLTQTAIHSPRVELALHSEDMKDRTAKAHMYIASGAALTHSVWLFPLYPRATLLYQVYQVYIYIYIIWTILRDA